MMSIQLWDILHDGEIKKILGTIPGKLSLTIEIPYLRHMFSTDGDNIIVNLLECSLFQYQSYETDNITNDFTEIENARVWILSATEEENRIKIACSEGTLWTLYNNSEVSLDNGLITSIDDLDKASELYWDNWEKESTENKGQKNT